MDKTCFVIMPISDCEPYPIGHFKRVYEYIIRPAVLQAGFIPLRADDVLNTNYIAIDIVKRIIESDMAICDLSSKNPNVLYELGIRQSFNLPVTLIRDSSTKRIFDIQGFRDIEYDEHLRIDNVELTIDVIAETIANTYKSKDEEINSLVSLLSIHPAKKSKDYQISRDTELILNVFSGLQSRLNSLEEKLIEKRSLFPNFEFDSTNVKWIELSAKEQNNLKEGDIIMHQKFGIGKIISIKGSSHNPIADVTFQYGESKLIMLNYARLARSSNN